MATFLVTVLVMGLVVAGMAVGVLMGRSPIKGSCGGMGALGINTSCDICGGDPQQCDEVTDDAKSAGNIKKSPSDLFYSLGQSPDNSADK